MNMANIAIHDLAHAGELDHKAMAAVRGGNSWLKGLGPVANVNVDIDQNIVQLQNIDVSVLNNVGTIGANFTAPHLNVSPAQWANAHAAV
jgi:hypothetical protein